MKNVIPKTIATIGIVFLIAILSYFVYVEYQVSSLEKDVLNYLIDDKGYSKDDIARVETGYRYISEFTSDVEFKDEPNVYYSYKRDSDGKIVQFSVSDADVEKWVQYKHYEGAYHK